MKTSVFCAVSAVVVTQMTMLPACAGQRTELLPGGTKIPVHIVGRLSSNSAHVGDVFSFVAANDVSIEGRIVVKKGAGGQGEVVGVDRAGSNGHSGSLELQYNYIHVADGGKIHLASASEANAEEDRKGGASTATIIGFATLGLTGLFGHNLVHGREVVIDETKTLTTFADSSVHVHTSENASDAELGFDH